MNIKIQFIRNLYVNNINLETEILKIIRDQKNKKAKIYIDMYLFASLSYIWLAFAF